MAEKKKKKNYWYVLVLTDEGPKFVTSVEYSPKVAYWNGLEKPLELGELVAKELALGLNANFFQAYPVCMPFETTNQPYYYKLGKFEWKRNEKQEEQQEEKKEGE